MSYSTDKSTSLLLSESTSLLMSTFAVDISSDSTQIHPTHYCYQCRNVMYRYIIMGEVYRDKVTVSQWSGMLTESACAVCLHLCDVGNSESSESIAMKVDLALPWSKL